LPSAAESALFEKAALKLLTIVLTDFMPALIAAATE
jgi:hypothetical protein